MASKVPLEILGEEFCQNATEFLFVRTSCNALISLHIGNSCHDFPINIYHLIFKCLSSLNFHYNSTLYKLDY